MKVPLLDLKAQYRNLRTEIRSAIDAVCDSQSFILGPKVEEFEKNVASYCGVREAVGVSSGTDALLIALMALGVGPGDAVLTSAYSFFATAGSIVRLGARPVFVDVSPRTFNIDTGLVDRALKQASSAGLRVKAMIPVHLFGQMADMDPLLDLARSHGLSVIEDAAQAIGAEYPSSKGARRAGAMGDMGCFSFFPSKNLGGFGDGGMVVTDNSDLAGRLRILRNHGAHPKYYHKLVGGNFRLDALQAAVLDVKLRHLESWHEGRRRRAGRYDEAFAGRGPGVPENVYRKSGLKNTHIYNQYVIRSAKRDRLMEHLKAVGIGCEIYYPVPLHLQECFGGLGGRAGDHPVSESAARETLALPVYPELTDAMQDEVIDAVLKGAA